MTTKDGNVLRIAAIIAMFLFMTAVPAIADGELNRQALLEPGVHRLNSPVVNFRSEPDSSAEIIGTGVFGQEIEVVERTEVGLTAGGYFAYWYRASTDQIENLYVWGGGLATDSVVADFDGDGHIECLVEYRMSDRDSRFRVADQNFMTDFTSEYYMGRLGDYWGEVEFSPQPRAHSEIGLASYSGEIGPNALLVLLDDAPVTHTSQTTRSVYWYDPEDARFELLLEYADSVGPASQVDAEVSLASEEGGSRHLDIQMVESAVDQSGDEYPYPLLYEDRPIITARLWWAGESYAVERTVVNEPSYPLDLR